MILAWRTFGGQRPRQSARLLANDGAEIAVNSKLWNGKLRAFHVGLDTFTTVKATLEASRTIDAPTRAQRRAAKRIALAHSSLPSTTARNFGRWPVS